MADLKILELLDSIESMITKSRRVPLSSKVIVDADGMLDIIDEVRVALPEEIKEALRLLAERERILGEARAEAERIIGSARERMQALINDAEIVKKAREYAQGILAEARGQAEEVRRGADDYAVATLKSLEESLERAQKVVHKGIEELTRRADKSPGARPSAGGPQNAGVAGVNLKVSAAK
ncbi:MAG TPA: ATP synthase F0 subunit B [Firmicutes bacterium]|nr:ATP synthase F0 subunit B [Bacillota bacterium]